jgi:transposase
VRYVGVDEKSFQRRYDFVTVVSDVEGARVPFVDETANGRAWKRSGPWASPTPNAARSRPSRWTCGSRTRRPPARRSPRADQKIVFDRFHCAKRLNEGVDRVRRAEQRDLRAQGDTRLTGTKYTWLRHPDRFTRAAWRAFGALRDSALKVARAWALKEAAADLWEYRYVGAARTFFRRWYFWATHSRLKPPGARAHRAGREGAGGGEGGRPTATAPCPPHAVVRVVAER